MRMHKTGQKENNNDCGASSLSTSCPGLDQASSLARVLVSTENGANHLLHFPRTLAPFSVRTKAWASVRTY